MRMSNKKEKYPARRLFLTGPMGCGKSTVIRQALGGLVRQAGGFVTVRSGSPEAPEGFDLAPAAWLADAGLPRWRFLSFVPGPVRENACFLRHGVPLLEQAEQRPFAVLDEVGGLELLLPEFTAALERFFNSGTPCIGVLKSRAAAVALAERTALPGKYLKMFEQFYSNLERSADTVVLEITPLNVPEVRRAAARWVQTYAVPFGERREE